MIQRVTLNTQPDYEYSLEGDIERGGLRLCKNRINQQQYARFWWQW